MYHLTCNSLLVFLLGLLAASSIPQMQPDSQSVSTSPLHGLWASPDRCHVGLNHILNAQLKVWHREEAFENSVGQLNLTSIGTTLYSL